MNIAPPSDLARLYDRLAPRYDRLHRRWLRFAGGEAQAALEAAVRAAATPDTKLLDVGCGTGVFARRLQADGFDADRLTLLDPAPAMLNLCADIPCAKLCGSTEALPFATASFDIVTSAWALETVGDPYRALLEMRRVLRPGGLLCLAFCAQQPPRGILDWAISHSLRLRGTGQFLSVDRLCATIKTELGGEAVSVPLTGPAAMVMARFDEDEKAR